MILSAQTIRRLGIISPFYERTDHAGVTYGLGPAGYDIRIAEHSSFINGRFGLASTIEHFNMPNDVLGIVTDKSTWARRGLAVQKTVIEPGWRGFLTLELSFHGNGEMFIEKGSGIAQIIFHRLDEPTEIPYVGKYQDQAAGPQGAR